MKTVLVTGANRSGTTWVGKMLSCSDKFLEIWEPFNHLLSPSSKIVGANPFPHHYHYVLEEEAPKIKSYINRRLLFSAYRVNYRGRNYSHRLFQILGLVDHLLRIGMNTKQILIKDPIALLSADWIAREYQAQVIVLIRHPAAYVNSIKRVNWNMSLEELLPQKEFLATLPDSLVREISDRVANQSEDGGYNLEDAALSWKVFHRVIYQYQQVHPNWIFVRHEDLCEDFITGFRRLYAQLALPWSIENQALIQQYCTCYDTERLGSKVHVLRRDSRSTSQLWKQSLSTEEVKRIREITKDIANLFYDEDSWS